MRLGSRELWYALLAIIMVTVVYALFADPINTPFASSSPFGHVIGVIGFVFMLMTELLYSLRKHYQRAARWGRMESWLKFHIFTGIVGPYMVLLHTAWRFQGLAGVVTLMMLIVVGSGFIGRYIYTLLPRTDAGVEVDESGLKYNIAAADAELLRFITNNSALVHTLPQYLVDRPKVPRSSWLLIFGRVFMEWSFNWRWWRETRIGADKPLRELKRLLDIRRKLNYQIAVLLLARRILALWHRVHVPLGIVLFITAFIHIGAAVYYVTLAK